MKKLFISIFAILILSACGGSTEKCQYTKMTLITYNLNKEAASLITGDDTTEGCYSVTKHDGAADLKDSKSDFRILMKMNPNTFEVTKAGKKNIWKQENGYRLGNTMSGDTLILRYVPSKETPDHILKVGVEYKFYN